ncbi:LysM peptidoglycan-binding domain-containing protein [Enterococcus faecalis]|uniref:LysM peptidoglycan-binding domain-containing protein n=1 Tax=Enterococcus faecalis TaxID=1351 RepID=UPI001C111E5A|nr:LysM peptidoglycan-binding domain-containing protein [Enterococcus faecalis]MBU5339946.1 LysM peptidoglycan-binding domain-containing protein [Enterococcus faecalis]MDJ9036998.1 LysM peptidoglycan-binding domain-containing protein [Enterococcus faecalis]MDJ9040016.1 LysM peptidoglycan-binding domain-containing protein [Enterococcus faecalis]MDK4429743.1 LysM peptidoglycan-binding domain-containing protein [Enterococcus faecalis]WPH45500.1 LysM peptidoglycan-binding domain-containing protein
MKIMKVLAIGVTVGGIALAMNSEKADAAEWTPRTAEQIKAEIKGNEYTIVWGDTLSAISQATNITVQKLADMNKIANVDLIYAGNKLSFAGNVASVQNSAGETVAQTVIQDKDKVNPSQPVGQPAQEATTNNAGVGNTQTGNGNQAVGNTEVTPSAPEQTPVQPDNNVNQGEQTTPSTPENNGNTGENQPSNPGNGGTTTPEQPNQPGGGNTDKPSTPSNEYDPMTPIGSGGLFGSEAEATAAGQEKALELSKQGQGDFRVVVWEVKYTDGRIAGWTYELAV